MYNLSAEQLQKIARTIYAEVGVLKGNFPAHLAVGQCIRDIWETKELGGISLEDVLERAFNGKSETYDDESLQAARAVFEQGVVRYPNARIIQFRSFTNYGIDGNPDKEKLADLYKNYVYLGKDSVGEQGHFYFGRFGMKILVVIDPGHYTGYNPWALEGHYEGNEMFRLSEIQKEELERRGIDVLLTKNSADENPGLFERGQIAARMKGKYDIVIFVSNHDNAPGRNTQNPSTIRGTVIFTSMYRINKTRDFLEGLQAVTAAAIGCPKREISVRAYTEVNPRQDYWGVIRGAMDGAESQEEADLNGVDYALILEHDFHTNPEYCRWMADDANKRKVAAAQAQYIAEYFATASYQICNGTLRIVYGGIDGVNLHSSPDLRADSVIGTLYYNNVRRAVGIISLSDGTTMYRLEDGEYITASGSYVQYTSNGFNNYVAKVTADMLNVRDFPSSLASGGNVVYVLVRNNLVEVTGEAYNNGQRWLMVWIRNAEVNVT